MVSRLGKAPAAAGAASRIPPHNLEAEESVLGACLLSRQAIAAALEIVSPEDFYKPAHAEIFRAILDLYARGEPVDAVTLAEELRRRGRLDEVGGKPYIFTLVSSVPTPGSAAHYARIASENAVLRRLIQASQEIADLAYSVPEDVEEAVDQAEDLIYQVAQRRASDDFRPLKDLLAENMELVEKLYERGSSITGLPSGFSEFDEITAGLQPANLIIVAARPAMGKSSFAVTIAQHVAVHEQVPVVIFSLEMSRNELVQRLICSEARVDSNRLRRGSLSDSDWPKLAHAMGRLAEAPIFIDDTANVTIMEMRAKCRRLASKHGLGLVIVDYLQLMQPLRRTDNRVQEVSEISRSLKILARELDLPVIAVSQLSRNLEHRTDKRPVLADLRDCVTGDTRVALADGRHVPIAELVGHTPQVLALGGDGRVLSAGADRVWSVGVREVYSVRLASGRTIRATRKHRLLTASGWRRIKDLAIGDRVAVARMPPDPPQVLSRPEARVALLGHPFGDGSYMTHRGLAAMLGEACSGSFVLGGSGRGLSRNRLAGIAEATGSDVLTAQATSDVFWDGVMEVAPDGTAEVYDLTVPGPASWLSEGIVTHNSGALEQDADLVVFIYRDEVYNSDSSQKGIAEIHISKHRNGPIGKVELAFLEHYTKFANLARSP